MLFDKEAILSKISLRANTKQKIIMTSARI